MNSSSTLFLTKNSRPHSSTDWVALCRQAVEHLFPYASVFQEETTKFSTPSSYFLEEKGKMFWVEIIAVPFTRTELCDYLAKARQVKQLFPIKIEGILVAPEFDPGVYELLEVVEMSIQCLRYQAAIPLGHRDDSEDFNRKAFLWIEPVRGVSSNLSSSLSCEPPYEETEAELEMPPEPVSSCQRLSREELREFIQFELDAASGKPIDK